MWMDDDYLRTLAWVNERRVARYLKPFDLLPRPVGCACPLLAAMPFCLRAGMKYVVLAHPAGQLHEITPEYVRGFYRKWLDGVYPQLIAEVEVPCQQATHHVSCPWAAERRRRVV